MYTLEKSTLKESIINLVYYIGSDARIPLDVKRAIYRFARFLEDRWLDEDHSRIHACDICSKPGEPCLKCPWSF